MPGSSEPQDAASMRKLEPGKHCHPREGPNTSGLTEPGMDARLHLLHRAAPHIVQSYIVYYYIHGWREPVSKRWQPPPHPHRSSW